MSNFKSLKKNRKQQLEDLQNKLDQASNGKKNYNDDRFWKLPVDNNDNGYAIIRFLPANGTDNKFSMYYDYGFKGPGGWYIEKSLESIGGNDPVQEMYWKLVNSGQKEEAKKFRRRINYVANIQVVKCPKRPEDEGKVFLFKFGAKIFDKIVEATKPPFDDNGNPPDSPNYDKDCGLDPFCMWEGASFKLASRRLNGFRNYDASEFMTKSPAAPTETEMEAIFDQTYNVDEFVSPSSYKTDKELREKLAKVLQAGSTSLDQDDEPSAGKTSPSKFDQDASSNLDDDFDFDSFVEDIEKSAA